MLLIVAEDYIDESCLLLSQPYGILAVQATIVDAQTCEYWQCWDRCRGNGMGVTPEGLAA